MRLAMRSRKPKSAEIPLNCDLPPDLVESVDKFCERYKLRKKAVVELALRKLLASVDTK